MGLQNLAPQMTDQIKSNSGSYEAAKFWIVVCNVLASYREAAYWLKVSEQLATFDLRHYFVQSSEFDI